MKFLILFGLLVRLILGIFFILVWTISSIIIFFVLVIFFPKMIDDYIKGYYTIIKAVRNWILEA